VVDGAPQHLRLAVDALQVQADEGAREDVAVLDDHPIVSLRHDVHGALFEVREAAVGHLQVGVNRYDASRVIGFIADEVAIDQIDGRRWEAHQCSELLVQAIWDGLESQGALSENDTS